VLAQPSKIRSLLMRMPDELLKCVAFLCVQNTEEQGAPYKYIGTGFFVGVSESINDRYDLYLVTAKHCVEKPKSRGYGPLFLRMNTVEGGAEIIEIHDEWRYSDSEVVDVAVLPLVPDRRRYEYMYLKPRMCLTDDRVKENGVGIGQDLYITGLFTQRSGNQKNIPIIRNGTLAAMPDEPLMDDESGLSYRAYLAEVRSLGGLSGSPVFVSEPPLLWANGADSDESLSYEPISRSGEGIFLLGMIRGHWDMKEARSAIAYTKDELNQVHTGMAIVTPWQEVMDVLNDEELVRLRRQNDRAYRAQTAPTLGGTQNH
jgi:hypothetical protein